jgi:hypothetical protein
VLTFLEATAPLPDHNKHTAQQLLELTNMLKIVPNREMIVD